jgi:histone H3/H4
MSDIMDTASTSGKPAPVSRRERRRRREVKQLQENSSVLQRAPFQRCVREELQAHGNDLRVSPQAMQALQCAAEDMLNDVFERAATLAQHSHRDTIAVRDVQLATQ